MSSTMENIRDPKDMTIHTVRLSLHLKLVPFSTSGQSAAAKAGLPHINKQM